MLQDITAQEERQEERTSNRVRTWDLHFNAEFNYRTRYAPLSSIASHVPATSVPLIATA